MWTVESLMLKTDVSCVKIIKDYIFVGIGGLLHIFDRRSAGLKNIVSVFYGQKIYGMDTTENGQNYLVYGGKEIKTFQIQSISFCETASCTCKDWILQAKWLDGDTNIATILMHNIIVLWSKNLQPLKRILCEERCILYGATLVNRTWSDLIVVSGTVFSQVLLWRPIKADDNHVASVNDRLVGHKGVIFAVDYDPKVGMLCSASDDRSVRLWSVVNDVASLKCSMFGHSARVFGCKVLHNQILSIGEDSLINMWDFEGKLVRTIEAHQNASVWAIDCDDREEIVVSGGGDCGATLFPLRCSNRTCQVVGDFVPKRLAFLGESQLVGISEMGVFSCYDTKKEKWYTVNRHDDLVSYALLEVAPARNRVALAGFRGTIYVYVKSLNGKNLDLLCSCITENKSRIYSLHWLSDDSFLTCETDGILQLWNVDNGSLKVIKTFIFPECKERWTSAACSLSTKCFCVGGRNGNIYVYNFSAALPKQSIYKAHNYLGVTHLRFANNILTSLGRNSTLRKFRFNQSKYWLDPIFSDKLPFSWLCSIRRDVKCYETLILAFSSNDFIIWDYDARRIVAQIPCSGGHRSWDLLITGDVGSFAYIKDKRIVFHRLDWQTFRTVDLISGYHTSEINEIEFLPLSSGGIIISGGEDTTLRIARVNFDETVKFENVCTLKSHLSSIRVVRSYPILNDEALKEYWIISAGGRAQIIMWKLSIETDGPEPIITCTQTYSHYEQVSKNASEVRIMDFCLIDVEKPHKLLVVAQSDGFLKVYRVTQHLFELGEVFYNRRCILKVVHIKILGVDVVILTGTDGIVSFWDFSPIVEHFYTRLKVVEANNDLIPGLEPFKEIKIHQSGINAVAFKLLDDSTCLCLTGGDDSASFLNLIKFDRFLTQFNVQIISTVCNINSHCSQVTGVFLEDGYFLTASVDQRLNVFEWSLDKYRLTCNHVKRFESCVADIQGLKCYVTSDCVYVYLYGNGVELVKLIKLKT